MWYSIQTLLFCNIYMHRLYIIKSISPKAPTKQILGSSRIIWLARRYRRALVLSRDTEDPSQWEADLKVHSVAVVAGRQHSQSVSLFAWTLLQPEVKRQSFKLPDQTKTTLAAVPEPTPILHDTFSPAGKAANVTSCWLPLSRHSYAVLADIFSSVSHQQSNI